MTHISHHIPDDMIRAYASGSLGQAFSLVVAAHVSMCDRCRAQLEAEEAMGGAVLESVAPASGDDEAALGALMAKLDGGERDEPAAVRSGIYPGPVNAALRGNPPRWKRLGAGIRQDILHADAEGSVRLLFIPEGSAVPDHGHRGTELTLVLQGSFSDVTGAFGVGDVEVADDSLDHVPTAGTEAPCICLAATEGSLRFRSLVPSLLQPIFRI